MLVAQLPRGSRLGQAIGGPPTWTDEVAAVHLEGYAIRQALHSLIGATAGKRVKDAKPIEPPAEGWQGQAREKHERQQRKARRWLERQQKS